MFLGIDVSDKTGSIDWKKVKESGNVKFAIIRMGYGSYLPGQEDKEFENNVKGAIKNNIPFAVYLYSYAKYIEGDQTKEETVASEILNAKKRLEQISSISKEAKPFAVYYDLSEFSKEDKEIYYDLEDEKDKNKTRTDELYKETLTSMAVKFCDAISYAGYRPGIYMTEYGFKTKINVNTLSKNGYSLWVAKFLNDDDEKEINEADGKFNKLNGILKDLPQIGVEYDIWNLTDKGELDGISNNTVCFDYMINEHLLDGYLNK
jgi:GH25 family lysozyme M1 (1,4-beta-N-acetylmuramidase)